MSEYVRDPDKLNGWKVVTYSSGKKTDGGDPDGIPVVADSMDEECAGVDSGNEAEVKPAETAPETAAA